MRHDSHTWLVLAREKAWMEQHGRCAYCTAPLPRTLVTADHVLARRHGGTDAGNIAAACRDCNFAKGSMPARAFKRLVRSPQPLASGTPLRIQVQRVVYRIQRRADIACARVLASVGARAG